MAKLELFGKPVISGKANGIALVSREPLSFWGGYDWKSGEITDRRHPLSGENASGKVLVVPFTRGSSTTTAVLLEAIREGTAPAAIISPIPNSAETAYPTGPTSDDFLHQFGQLSPH